MIKIISEIRGLFSGEFVPDEFTVFLLSADNKKCVYSWTKIHRYKQITC